MASTNTPLGYESHDPLSCFWGNIYNHFALVSEIVDHHSTVLSIILSVSLLFSIGAAAEMVLSEVRYKFEFGDITIEGTI